MKLQDFLFSLLSEILVLLSLAMAQGNPPASDTSGAHRHRSLI
jgi:hypothetical protein